MIEEKVIEEKVKTQDTEQMKVLIADDDLPTRMLLRAAVNQWGYHVVEAGDGEEAWQILNKSDPPKLLVLDWLMPKMDGVALCARIKKDLPYHPYVILLTQVTGTSNIVKALEAGADEFLTKPFNMAELRSRLSVGAKIIGFKNSIAEQSQQLNQYVNQIETLAEVRARQLILHTDFVVMLGALIVQITQGMYDCLNNIDFDSTKPLNAQKEAMDRKEFIDLQRNLKKIIDLIRGLRSRDTVKTHTCKVSDALQVAVDICHIPLKHVQIDLTNVKDVPDIHADSYQIVQAFAGLILNTVEILKRERKGLLRLETALSKDKTSIVVITECSGPVILPADLGKIFQPHFGATEPEEKTLSLSVVMSRDILQKFGGTLRIETRSEGGLRFLVDLPIHQK